MCNNILELVAKIYRLTGLIFPFVYHIPEILQNYKTEIGKHLDFS